MKISFDFDDTLSTHAVQRFARMCVKSGFDVHVVTSRMSNERAQNPGWNDDLFIVTNMLNIPDENVHFCNLKPKHVFFLENPDFKVHLDDDSDEVDSIKHHCSDTQAVLFVDTIDDVCIHKMKALMYKE